MFLSCERKFSGLVGGRLDRLYHSAATYRYGMVGNGIDQHFCNVQLQVVYPVAKDQQATVRIPVSLANADMVNLKGINLEGITNSETINLKGIDLSQLPVLNMDGSTSSNSGGSSGQQQAISSSSSNISSLSVISLVKGSSSGRHAHSK